MPYQHHIDAHVDFSAFDGFESPKKRKIHAYGLPSGSIRALLALMVFGAIWVLLSTRPHQDVPSFLRDLMFIIMGHYFASRKGHVHVDGEPNPLWLPKGSVRVLLLTGFVIVAGVLTHESKWVIDGSFSNSGITLILVAGFMLGVLRSYLFPKHRLWLENVRATVSLGAAATLLALIFGYIGVPETLNIHAHQYHFRYEEVLAGLVGFYFGSKS